MRKKINCILLIDDDKATNFLHKEIIRETGLVNKVVDMESGHEALEYLEKMEDGKYPQPDIIFLDINMPAMSGWEFLEEYDKLDEEKKAKIVVVMLTTSINPDDKETATSKELINGFFNKPLTFEIIERVIDENF
ncbi:response regulator [uncultured Cyclobacterium sp.]|uniref:response regulator n=1 Tax=uncultured Cyclobacterium sp. TaxID=453820 RepID=UPI0030EDDABB|tara:strand:- start:1430 stop:1834 length:405 start_codon:yes stop_codon:yes gene_type:complete